MGERTMTTYQTTDGWLASARPFALSLLPGLLLMLAGILARLAAWP